MSALGKTIVKGSDRYGLGGVPGGTGKDETGGTHGEAGAIAVRTRGGDGDRDIDRGLGG